MAPSALPVLLALLAVAPAAADAAAGTAEARRAAPAAAAGRVGGGPPSRIPGPSTAAPGSALQAATDTTAPARDSARALLPVLDSLVRGTLEGGRIPGLALVVLGDGRVAAARGYGVADRASGRPVSPDSTRFALGSMSKLVTAAAALQLREEGRLSLHEPAGRHLPPGVLPPGPGGPVTLHHLLTHTAGLESASVGVAARRPEQLEGLEAYLTSSGTPRRVRPPGSVYVYSQHGYGMVGLAVQRASGRPFPAYAEEAVFRPLGMTSAGFRPAALDHPRTAPGYHWEEGELRPAPTVYHRIPPAGGLVATPRDMASLLAALLRGGVVSGGGSRVLSPEAAGALLRRQWAPRPHPAVEGTSYGLFAYRACGLRGLTSRGWVGGHSSYLHLVPGRDAGLLVTANASSLQGLQSTLRHALHRHLAGGACRSSVAAADSTGRAAGSRRGTLAPGVAGHYRSLGFAGTGIESLGRTFLAGEVEVRRSGPGRADVVLGGSTLEGRAVAPRVLAATWGDGQEELFAFPEARPGGAGYMMWGGASYRRVSLLGRRATAWALAALAMGLFLSGLAVPLGRAVLRLAGRGGGAPGPRPAPDGAGAVGGAAPEAARRDGAPSGRRGGRVRALRWGAVLLSATWLAFVAGVAAHLVGTRRYAFAFGVPETLSPLLWLPLFGTVAAAGLALAGGVTIWRGGGAGWPLWERVQWAAVVAAGLLAGGWAISAGLTPW